MLARVHCFARAMLVALTTIALSATFRAAPLSAQKASIGGTVLSDPSEQRLANAEIVINGLNRSTRSDSAGNFLFTGLPAGKHQVVVRLVGYLSSTMEISVRATQSFDADFMIRPLATTLEKFDVKGKAKPDAGSWKLAEFEERRTVGFGTYVTKEEFEKEGGRPPSSILRSKLAGIKVIQVNGQSFLATSRGGGVQGAQRAQRSGLSRLPNACYMQVVVDGIVRWDGSGADGRGPRPEMFNIDELSAREIIGLEFYTTANTPAQYNGTRGLDSLGCGTVIIWTKGGGR